MAVTDLTSLISPGMKLTTTSSARTIQAAQAAPSRAEMQQPEYRPEPEPEKPKLSEAPEEIIQGKSDVIIQEPEKKLGWLGALNLVREVFTTQGVEKSQELFQDTVSGVKAAVNTIQKPIDADQLADEQYRYQDRLGKTQIVLGESIGTVLPRIGQLLKGSGREILVSRDYNKEGLINLKTGEINRPSVYEIAAFGSALGAAGAAIGSGAVTGVSGFGSLFPKVTAAAVEKSFLDSAVTGGGSAGGSALANVGANVGKTGLLGLSTVGSSLQEIDSGIGDIISQYPRRNQYEERAPAVSGEVDIGIGDIISQYPARNRYGDRYSRNDANRNQNWNRSELDYRETVGSGYSTNMVEDLIYRSRFEELNRNRTEYDSLYEYAALTEVAPQNRRRSRYDEEEESFIAEPRRKSKKKKRTFTERLIL